MLFRGTKALQVSPGQCFQTLPNILDAAPFILLVALFCFSSSQGQDNTPSETTRNGIFIHIKVIPPIHACIHRLHYMLKKWDSHSSLGRPNAKNNNQIIKVNIFSWVFMPTTSPLRIVLSVSILEVPVKCQIKHHDVLWDISDRGFGWDLCSVQMMSE